MGVMRPLHRYAEAMAALEGAPPEADVTAEWLKERAPSLSKRQVLDALKLARDRGTLTWVSRGVWRRPHLCGVA